MMESIPEGINEELLVKEWGFDLDWVKKANKQCERNRKRGK